MLVFLSYLFFFFFFFFQAEDGIRDHCVTGVQTCALPIFREVLVLRELEGCSYKEIASITAIPIGTVMSALARGRQRLQRALTHGSPQEIGRASCRERV